MGRRIDHVLSYLGIAVSIGDKSILSVINICRLEQHRPRIAISPLLDTVCRIESRVHEPCPESVQARDIEYSTRCPTGHPSAGELVIRTRIGINARFAVFLSGINQYIVMDIIILTARRYTGAVDIDDNI